MKLTKIVHLNFNIMTPSSKKNWLRDFASNFGLLILIAAFVSLLVSLLHFSPHQPLLWFVFPAGLFTLSCSSTDLSSGNATQKKQAPYAIVVELLLIAIGIYFW